MNINLPELSEGETYVGCIGDAAGNLHHVILLPGDNDDATHEAQLEWAKSIGGDLPNRSDQAGGIAVTPKKLHEPLGVKAKWLK